MGRSYTVAVDFDGVIHRYDTPWIAPHVIPDEPVEGAIEWLHDMAQRFNVVVYTTRARTWRGRRAVRRWLRYWSHPRYRWRPDPEEGSLVGARVGIRSVRVTAKKPPALIYLDDRAVRFTGPGSWPSVQDVHRALPWHKVPAPELEAQVGLQNGDSGTDKEAEKIEAAMSKVVWHRNADFGSPVVIHWKGGGEFEGDIDHGYLMGLPGAGSPDMDGVVHVPHVAGEKGEGEPVWMAYTAVAALVDVEKVVVGTAAGATP